MKLEIVKNFNNFTSNPLSMVAINETLLCISTRNEFIIVDLPNEKNNLIIQNEPLEYCNMIWL
jgi:hypothetical protein